MKHRITLLLPAVIVFLLVVILGSAAHSTPAEYHPRAAAEQKAMVLLYVKTRHCMRDATLAILRQGITDKAAILTFTRQTCGIGLHQLLMNQARYSRADATDFINELAVRELTYTLGLSTL